MPRIKRWFPVSHDINRDPELWELRTKYGEKILACWLELLSIADRNDGLIPGTLEQVASTVSWHIRVKRVTCLTYIRAITDARWLHVDKEIRVVNYSKYHRTREYENIPPDQTEPDRTLIKNKNKMQTLFSNPRLPIVSDPNFPENWQWLKNWVERQDNGFPINRFLDWKWWDAVSETCGGLSEEWLEKQAAAWRRWIMDNPQRAPTVKGYRRFIAGWLERSYEKERKYPNGERTERTFIRR